MLRAAVLGLLAIASFAAVYVAMAPSDAPRPQATGDATPLATGELRPAATEPEERVAVAFQLVRDVTPETITAPPAATAPLRRVAPAAAPPAPPPEARSERLFNPVIASAGIVIAGGQRIRLAGVDAPTFAERCGEGAAAWPCGRMGRAALRRFVRGRAIECEIPAGGEEVPDPALCRVAGEDLSEWLVENGWATNVGAYAAAEGAAREERLGLWAEDRPDQLSEPAASSPESARAMSERVSSIP